MAEQKAKRRLALLLSVIILPSLLFAPEAVIKGKVTDPDGQPLSEVKITLRDTARGHTYTIKTNKKGDYFLMGVPPFDYKMTVEKPGYQTLEGIVSISLEKENVFDVVLAEEVKEPETLEWDKLNAEANELYRQGRNEEALDIYGEILEMNPKSEAILFNMGNCSYQLNRHVEAVEFYKKAIEVRPDFNDAYINLANAYGKTEEIEEGIAFFEGAAQANPENSAVLSSLGLLYLNANQAGKAAENLEKAASLDPENSFYYYSLGIAYTQLTDYKKAVEKYEKYLVLNPDSQEAERVKALVEQLKLMIKN